MGPQASSHLHSLIVVGVGKGKAPDEFPMIIHASIPTPDFIATPEAAVGAVKMIQDVTSNLPMKTASVIGLACNTAHLLLDDLTNIPRKSFVSMIDAVADDIESAGHKKVGLLASPFTIKSELYHKALKARGIAVLQPNTHDIDALSNIIHGVISNHVPLSMRRRLTDIAKRLESQGVDCILLGCTELPLVGIISKLPTIDSLSSLSKAMLKRQAEVN
ncbi:MAG: aspartate racemase [Candidatus Saccharibacteria bacterium]|nr:aspartate racemase [Candidatus Saccharibacteria bacterium]